MTEVKEDEIIEFKWGKKKGIGGLKKDVQFYESFTYDGLEYSLYDSAYLFGEGENEPYIGKIVKIWEQPNKAKKVKILWFFRPCEISNYLKGIKFVHNELFLASGDGERPVGLANVNPLEAIAGKCNIVCTSKDSRNPQPSIEEIEKADFTFYRTFDVVSHVISDKMDNKIAQVDVKFLLNKVNGQKSSTVSDHDSIKKEISGNVIAGDGVTFSSEKLAAGQHKIMKTDGNAIDHLLKGNEERDMLLANQKSSVGQKSGTHSHEEPNDLAKIGRVQEKLAGGKIIPTSKAKDKVDSTTLGCQKSSVEDKAASNISRKLGDDDKASDLHQNTAKSSPRTSEKEIADSKPSLTKQKSSLGEKSTSNLGTQLNKMDNKKKQESFSNDEITSRTKDDPASSDNTVGKAPIADVQTKESIKAFDNYGRFADSPSKNDELDGSLKASEGGKEKIVQTSTCDSDSGGARAFDQTATVSKDKSKRKLAKDPNETDIIISKKPKHDEKPAKFTGGKSLSESPNKVSNDAPNGLGDIAGKVPAVGVKAEHKTNLNDDFGKLTNKSSKNNKLDTSLQESDGKKEKTVQKCHSSSHCGAKRVDQIATGSEDKSKYKLAEDPLDKQIISCKKPKTDDKPHAVMPRESREAFNDVSKTGSKILEVTRKPETDKSKWFAEQTWEDRIKAANGEQKLVLLQNLDPSYTGAEVEDIVWHGLKLNCSAKMIPRVSYFSPHTGKALAIFKTRAAAGEAVAKLDEGCLILSNGRPLVGSIANLSFSGRATTFFGHMSIDKHKQQMQREMREAVSTSHCSQPNTIEYDMAMEWCLLQEQTNLEWERLYEKHGRELAKLKVRPVQKFLM